MILPKTSVLEAKGYDIPLHLDNYLMKLDLNESAFGPSPRVIEALKNITADDIRFYPAYGDLISKLAHYNSVESSMILPTNGADEALNYVFDTFVSPDDTVITVKPAFSMPKLYAKGIGCTYKEVPYENQWEFPMDAFVAALAEKPKMVIVTTPNNPTGEAISRENLVKIVEACPDTAVMIDETYGNYADQLFTDLAMKYNNVIIVRSLSKDFGLAGLRLGYLISNAQNIDYMKRIISPYSVNTIAAKAGVAALSDIAYFDWVRDNINKSRIILKDGLRPFIKEYYNTDANFLFADFGESAEFVYNKLLNAGIKVKDFKGSPRLENCLRITYPSPEDAKKLVEAVQPRKIVVFDIDGVLVDTSNSYRMAIKSTFEYFSNESVSFEEIQEAKNLGGLNNDWDLTEYLLRAHGLNTPKDKIIEKFQEFYLGTETNAGYINNEKFLLAAEFVKNISKTYDLAVFTGRPRAEAFIALKNWGIAELFLSVVAMEDVPDGKHKPDPWGLEHIKNISHSDSIIYLGDTPDDMLAASKAGVTAVGVLPPQDKSEELKNRMKTSGAVVILEKTEDLAGFLERECKTI